MNELMKRLKSATKLKGAGEIKQSKVFLPKEMSPTPVPMLNVALSGSLNGGVTPGLTVLAGPSKHYKSSFALLMAAAFLNKHPDGILLFYDSEFGITPEYLETAGIDMDRTFHIPIMDIEELKFDLMHKLEKEIDKTGKDKVFILIDSIGNLASKKEREDAISEKSVADMTRAKMLKGLFRMVTPYLATRDIPLVAINHTYKEQSLFPKDIVSGGTGIYYSANTIFIIGRQQEKKGTIVEGYNFILNVEKSRFVKEKSKIPILVTWEGGVSLASGLLEIALEAGFVTKPSNGWYAKVDQETGEIGEKARLTETREISWWTDILQNEKFAECVENAYKINAQSNFDPGEIEAIDE